MTSVLHVIDRTCDETRLQVLETLRVRLGPDLGSQAICSVDPHMARRAGPHIAGEILRAPERLRVFDRFGLSRDLQRISAAQDASILHAWGIDAARLSLYMSKHLPVVMSVHHSADAGHAAFWARQFPDRIAVVASGQVIRSQVIGAGVPESRVVVIRGPVDFGAINRARREGIRQRIVGDARPVLLMNGPLTAEGAGCEGIWAAAIVKQLYPALTVLLPYESRHRQKAVRLAESVEHVSVRTVPDSGLSWPQLAACSDLFLMPAIGEVCTEPLGTAMAAGIPIVASAVRGIAEIIASRHNGFLCKDVSPVALSGLILTALEDTELRRKVTETARAQAYEMFGVQVFLENYRHLYENLVAGRPLDENVLDTAVVA